MNLLIRKAPTWPLLQFVLVTLALMPALIYGHGHHGKKHAIALAQFAGGAQLVMETHSGDRLVRQAREATPEEIPSSVTPIPATVGGGTGAGVGSGIGKRVKNNNKKSNKSQNPMQHSGIGAGAGDVGNRGKHKKSSSSTTGEETLQHQQHQQHQPGHHKPTQRQMVKHQQQQTQEQHQHRAGKRSGTKSKTTEKSPTCRYAKSAWTECDPKTNKRSRTLTLKRANSNCAPTKTIEKKCKKACRYEKGTWSECTDGQMTREDKLKPAEESNQQQNCKPVRTLNKKCPNGGDKQAARGTRKERKHKDKATRRTSLPA